MSSRAKDLVQRRNDFLLLGSSDNRSGVEIKAVTSKGQGIMVMRVFSVNGDVVQTLLRREDLLKPRMSAWLVNTDRLGQKIEHQISNDVWWCRQRNRCCQCDQKNILCQMQLWKVTDAFDDHVTASDNYAQNIPKPQCTTVQETDSANSRKNSV